ncbi:MAG: Xaa-Pro peptidase family protein [Granulosicoccus sp.]|nr:Xaa-Pro peptidase family protein [Granulosicoccus sp.]
MQSKSIGGRHQRKIDPCDWSAPPSTEAHVEQLKRSREKAASLNQHAIGYGALAEAEWNNAGLLPPDLMAMRHYRLQRIRQELVKRDLAGIHLYDPLNIRYATDCTNMQLWTTHNPVRSVFIATDGPVILFEFHNCEHLSDHTGVVDEVRPCTAWFYFEAGNRCNEFAHNWAEQINDLLQEHGGGNKRCAFDQLDSHGVPWLESAGVDIIYGEELMEEARKIKSDDEIVCMRRAIVSCEAAIAEMEAALRPGISENDLWSLLHAGNIRRGGEWIETRLLSSGPRTNPWFQESSARIIKAGELVSFDTDLIGPYGFCCDISRCWLAGDDKPSDEQRTLYQIAAEQIAENTALLKPGISFAELVSAAKQLPADCMATRYGVLFHGVGLCDEYPSIRYAVDHADHGYDGHLEIGMCLCVESYVGRLGGYEGVKLEDQVLITENGAEMLSSYPLDQRLMEPVA